MNDLYSDQGSDRCQCSLLLHPVLDRDQHCIDCRCLAPLYEAGFPVPLYMQVSQLYTAASMQATPGEVRDFSFLTRRLMDLSRASKLCAQLDRKLASAVCLSFVRYW